MSPSCFISYSWDGARHKAWVRRLAEQLQANGVVTHIDQWDVSPGTDLTAYMETSIRESDFVLLICTPMFAQKANAGSGGVGYEKMIVTGEIFGKIAPETKFVPILRDGSSNDALPSYLRSKLFIDFRHDAQFVQNLEILLRHLHGSPKFVRPPLGPQSTAPPRNSSAPKQAPNVVRTTTQKQPPKSFDLASYKELYDFAYRTTGLNLNSSEANNWADAKFKVFSKENFAAYKELFDFAYKTTGLNLNSREAAEWAESMLQFFSTHSFSEFKEFFEFAYRVTGLNLTSREAVQWALKKMQG